MKNLKALALLILVGLVFIGCSKKTVETENTEITEIQMETISLPKEIFTNIDLGLESPLEEIDDYLDTSLSKKNLEFEADNQSGLIKIKLTPSQQEEIAKEIKLGAEKQIDKFNKGFKDLVNLDQEGNYSSASLAIKEANYQQLVAREDLDQLEKDYILPIKSLFALVKSFDGQETKPNEISFKIINSETKEIIKTY